MTAACHRNLTHGGPSEHLLGVKSVKSSNFIGQVSCGKAYCSWQTHNSNMMNDPVITPHNLTAAVSKYLCRIPNASAILDSDRSDKREAIWQTKPVGGSPVSLPAAKGVQPSVCRHLSERAARYISCFNRDPLSYIPTTKEVFLNLAYEGKWLILSYYLERSRDLARGYAALPFAPTPGTRVLVIQANLSPFVAWVPSEMEHH